MMRNGKLFYLEMTASTGCSSSLSARPGSTVDLRVQLDAQAKNTCHSFLDRLKPKNLGSGPVNVVSLARRDHLQKLDWLTMFANTSKPIFRGNLPLQPLVIKSALALIIFSGLSREFSGFRLASTWKLAA